jgi:hypothetical protein
MASKRNPFCVVPGCKAKQPHMDDPIVQGLHKEFSDPIRLTSWVKAALGELINSIHSDLKANRLLAYMSRWRQPEELFSMRRAFRRSPMSILVSKVSTLERD